MTSLWLACFYVLCSVACPNILTAGVIKNFELTFNESKKDNALSILANQEASIIAVVVSISTKRSLFEIIHINKPREILFLDVSELSSHFKSMDGWGEVVFEKKKKDETNVSITHVAEGKNNVAAIMPRMKQCPGKSVLAKMTGDWTITMRINAFKVLAKTSSLKKVVKIIVSYKSVAFENTDVDETHNRETKNKRYLKFVMKQMMILEMEW